MAAINYARRYWRQLQRRGYRLVEIVPGGKAVSAKAGRFVSSRRKISICLRMTARGAWAS